MKCVTVCETPQDERYQPREIGCPMYSNGMEELILKFYVLQANLTLNSFMWIEDNRQDYRNYRFNYFKENPVNFFVENEKLIKISDGSIVCLL